MAGSRQGRVEGLGLGVAVQQLAADTLELVFGRSASLPLAQHWHVLAARRVVAAVERGAQLTAGLPD